MEAWLPQASSELCEGPGRDKDLVVEREIWLDYHFLEPW